MRWGAYMKIVVFVDDTKHSFDAVKIAAQIAKETGAVVTILGIAPRYRDSELVKSYEKRIKDETSYILEQAEKFMNGKGIHPKVEILEDISLLNALNEVIFFIKEGGFDLVIIGSSGLTGLKKFFYRGIGRDMGTELMDSVPCSVLVVRG